MDGERDGRCCGWSKDGLWRERETNVWGERVREVVVGGVFFRVGRRAGRRGGCGSVSPSSSSLV